MYIVVGTPHVFQVQVPVDLSDFHDYPNAENLLDSFRLSGVAANYERRLFLFWSSSTFYLWNCQPAVQLFSLTRSADSISEFGNNVNVLWKADSSTIAVSVSIFFLVLIYMFTSLAI